MQWHPVNAFVNGELGDDRFGRDALLDDPVRKLADQDTFQISMTENGDPLENAIAERVNGIIKGEYLDCYQVETINQATELLAQVVDLYNQERPHMSIGNLNPEQIHQSDQQTERLWKNYYTKNRTLVNPLQD